MGACMLVRRAAVDEVGPLDERFFLFSEETDWCYRFRRRAGASSSTRAPSACTWAAPATADDVPRATSAATCASSPSTAAAGEAERARRLLRLALRLRGAVFPGERGRTYADAARWLGSARVPALLEELPGR